MRRAQQDPTRRRRTAPAVLGLGIAALLTVAACGSGQLAQTAGMPPAVNGGLGQAGKVAVRDAVIAFPATGRTYPAGGDAPLVVTIVNSGDTPDTLVSVTSPVSQPAALTGSTDLPAGASLVAGADMLDRPSGSAAPSVTSTATSSSSAAATSTSGSSASTSGSASSSSAASTTTTTTTMAATSSSAPVTVGQVSIVLKGLTATVQPGQSIPVTFTFAHAGAVTVQVPVAMPGGTPAQTPNPTPSE